MTQKNRYLWKHFLTVSVGMKRRSRFKAAIALLLLVLLVGGSLVFSITVAEIMVILVIVIAVIMILVSTIQSKLGGKRR
jgi:fatty acid desaturase